MTQYFAMKQQHPDAILLFRVGDFYETFGEDAVKAAKALSITLTARNNGGMPIELAGFPYHSLETYMPRLIRAGYRVAICEQLEKPSKEKKIVKRGVTEVITPGIATADQLLDAKRNNFLCSISFSSKGNYGISFLDISTGEFLISEGTAVYIHKLIQSLTPSEIIFSKGAKKEFVKVFGAGHYTFALEDWVCTEDYTREKLLSHFNTQNLKGFGIEEMTLGQIAAGSILHYLSTTENHNLGHIQRINRMEPDNFVWLDRFTIRNLELVNSQQTDGVPLIDIIDKTVSPMGSRLLKKWVVLPLKNIEQINARLNTVEHFIDQSGLRGEIKTNLEAIGDLERLISKVPLGKINPREVRQLRRSLEALEPIKILLEESEAQDLINLGKKIDPCGPLRSRIEHQLCDEPPVLVSKGQVINSGVSEALDEYRHIIKNSKELLADIQARESENTGITNLKIGFNNVFGYYLEVTNKYKDHDRIPDSWIRKQTLTNAERYITEELKVLEAKILSAQEKVVTLESELFAELVATIAEYIRPIQINSNVLANVDCLLSFAQVAQKNNYCRPVLNDGLGIDIKAGRHPVIEEHLEIGESFVPNDVYINNEDQQIIIITGPNMAGKSAILRQTALICILAQMGCYVPADHATLGIIDKVFTRVGASDNISSGESTFMVEMNETASIMNNISERSLILLDEIGRGTSTYDGISIAWSIVEYLHNNKLAFPKTLFATHYHELNQLADKFERIHNFNIATKEVGNKVIFLRKLVPGGSSHSFGIYVASLAGMPKQIVLRANEILHTLEEKSIVQKAAGDSIEQRLDNIPAPAPQLSIFETVDPTAGKIKGALLDLDMNSMTPIECMLKLSELKKLIEE